MTYIKQQLMNAGVDPVTAAYLTNAIMILGIALLSVIANYIARRIVLSLMTRVIQNNKFQWDDILLEHKVLHKLSHMVPAIIIYYFASAFPAYQHLIETGVWIYIIIVGMMVFSTFLNAVDAIYRTYEISKVRPIRGYIQVVKIIVFIIGGLLVIANLIGESPLILLSGIGALSAVMMLVFKDSLLGLVAGIQLTSNDMVRVGDWIEMPKYGADGDIIDISLNTVKVQNWDKTIVSLPSYTLISDSFKNWRGMQNAGGRRIKRSVYIDTSSIGFCTDEMIAKFSTIHYLTDYIASKLDEIESYHAEHQIDTSSNRMNGRALTNIGVFRIYIQQYLRHHPRIHRDMTMMVRQLAPAETGLPLEIYAFTNDIQWVVYEEVQSDIFDHILAVAPEFGLRVFQQPSGNDITRAMTMQIERGYFEVKYLDWGSVLDERDRGGRLLRAVGVGSAHRL